MDYNNPATKYGNDRSHVYTVRMKCTTHNIVTGTHHKENFFDDAFVGIGIKDVPEHPDYPEHSHDFTELVVVYEGSGINIVEGFEYPLVAGDVFVLNPGQKHAYKDTKHLHLCNVLFDADIIGLKSLDMTHLPGFHALFRLEPKLRKKNFNSRLHLRDKELMKARAVIEDIEQELEQKRPGFRLISKSELLLLIGKLSRWYDEVSREDSAKLMQIAKSIAHMEQTLYDPLSVEALAKMANMSERAFYRVFQKATGVSPNQYLTNLRLSQACELLKHSEMSITDVAHECGFQDNSYMTRQFKKHLGHTPSQFRKINQA